ncbi:MAG: helix-turn-helix domain-containing protein [Clostridiales bacterium]|nr:helix-turn-helix domain-containing protein [Clostridiales bacterium]
MGFKQVRWAVNSVSEDCSALIDQLVQIRKDQGLTQKQLAVACGLTQSVVARFESKRTTPTVATFCRIASALGASISITKAS